MAGALIQRSFQNIIQKYPNINKIETNYLKILIWIMMKLTKPALNFTSKNHRLDSEDLRKGGLIIYEPNAYNPGYNGGEYFEL